MSNPLSPREKILAYLKAFNPKRKWMRVKFKEAPIPYFVKIRYDSANSPYNDGIFDFVDLISYLRYRQNDLSTRVCFDMASNFRLFDSIQSIECSNTRYNLQTDEITFLNSITLSSEQALLIFPTNADVLEIAKLNQLPKTWQSSIPSPDGSPF